MPMSPDEIEALTRRYFTFRIIHLTSGNYAVFGLDGQLRYIGPDPLSLDLKYIPPEEKRHAPKKTLKLTAILSTLRKT